MTSDGLVVEPDRYRPQESSISRDENTGTAEIDPVDAVLTTPRQSSTSDPSDLRLAHLLALGERDHRLAARRAPPCPHAAGVGADRLIQRRPRFAGPASPPTTGSS